MRSFGAADQHSLYFLATWCKGGVQGSGAFDEFIRDACHRRGPSIWFELQKIGAAQHPGIERRAIIPAAFQFHCETARYHTACLQRPMVRSPQRRRENCVRFSSDSTPSLIGSRWTSVARARSNWPMMNWNESSIFSIIEGNLCTMCASRD